MAKAEDKPTGTLLPWCEIEKHTTWSGILIGNGASQAVWQPFGYASLFETAKGVKNPLTAQDLDLFTAMGTTNFERVLGSLAIARLVGKAMKNDTSTVEQRYQSIQHALVEAVHAKHVPHSGLTTDRLAAIRIALLGYDFVYSTNYDLLLYWAVMSEDGNDFKDFFWSERFNLANTKLWGKATKIIFLHGGLHLYRTWTCSTIKRRAQHGRSLLDMFGQPMEDHGDTVPLFVAEGTSKDKLAAIYRSDYLSFAYTRFCNHKGPLVIYGHSLSESDEHIIEAIKAAGVTSIAVSMRAGQLDAIISKKAAIISKLPNTNIFFFDATTHPLGADTLRVKHK